jgi:FixJ family two-component response regulator
MRYCLLDINQRLLSLSAREREVFNHVVVGRLNKQIAGDLGIAEKTVKVHRGRVMSKMKVRSVAQLVHLWDLVSSA